MQQGVGERDGHQHAGVEDHRISGHVRNRPAGRGACALSSTRAQQERWLGVQLQEAGKVEQRI
jgi:hypothetical protein